MRIAFVYDVIYPYVVGGVQLRYWELARRLQARGHDVSVYGMKHWAGPAVIYRDGVRLVGVCAPKELYHEGRRAFLPPVYVSIMSLLPLLRERYDVLDVANFPYFPFFSARIASMLMRTPLIVSWIEVWDKYWQDYLGKAGYVAQLIERQCARWTPNAIAISDMTRRDLTMLGYSRPIDVIPCGVDLGLIASVPAAEEAWDVVFFGRLIKEKGIDLLIRAIGRLAESRPFVRCLIVGSGPERVNLEEMLWALNLQRNVRIIPFVSERTDVFRLMKSAKVLALPSRREGFGIVALEANACGLPVVTIRHPQNACCGIIRDGENGYVCGDSVDSLAESLLFVLAGDGPSPDDCISAVRAYDWDEVATVAETYYRSVGDNKC